MITFRRIRWKNFLGTGDEWTQIELNAHPTTLIAGKNGSGKSTLLDALTFGLFGEPFRDINVPQLINDTNEREMLVEVEFVVGKTNYKVRRGLKPRTFEIFTNNKMVDQDAKARDYQKHLEQNILKFNKKTFVQIVVLGSASFVPFMQLTAADRRAIIEDLLDIQIFSVMNTVLKQRVSDMKDEYILISNQIELQNEKISLVQSYIKRLKADNAAAIADKRQVLEENREQRTALEQQIDEIREQIGKLIETTQDQKKIKERIRKLESAQDKLTSNISKTEKEIQFFQTTPVCPTCKQGIDSEFKKSTVDKKQSLIVEIQTALEKLESDLKASEARQEEIASVLKIVDEHEKRIVKAQSSISAIDKYLKKVQSEIDDLHERAGDSSEQEDKLRNLRDEYDSLNGSRDKLTERKHYLDIIAMMLKDNGIKTKIIRQYLPIINKYVNKFLAAMDFFATFTLDENFKETIHIRGSKERTYYQLSEGQKLRIDLAILFTWREVAKLKNSANTNLLIMDEIFESALDDTGVDDFLKLIQGLSKDVNIFIISPKGDPLSDKFANTIKFIEERGFSIMEQ